MAVIPDFGGEWSPRGGADIGGSIPLAGGLGIGADILGGALGAFGASNAASATAAADRAQAQADLGRARAYGLDAEGQGITAGNIQGAAGRTDRMADYRANLLIGKQRAGYAAGGVDIAGGSPLDVLADTQDQIAQEAKNRHYTARNQAASAGRQYDLDILSKTSEEAAAREATAAAGRAESGGLFGIFSSILGAGAKALPLIAAL